MDNLAIGEIAQKAGIAASAIRYYEQIGLLPPAKRISGKRRYDLSILQKIRLIQLAKDAGLTIEEIQTLLHDFPEGTTAVGNAGHLWQKRKSRNWMNA